MPEIIGKMFVVGSFWLTLIWCAGRALSDLVREWDRRALEHQDGFTPSMARWSYVGEKRGQK